MGLSPRLSRQIGEWLKMKLTMNKITQGEDEVIIKYREMNERIETIAGIVQGNGYKICAYEKGQMYLVLPEHIYYLESVDGITFAYLKDKVCRVQMSLLEAAACYADRGFFRCAKSMVINIYRIEHLKSEPGNRILATMENGEKVIISRKYAKGLRQILKGGEE